MADAHIVRSISISLIFSGTIESLIRNFARMLVCAQAQYCLRG